MGKSEGGAGNSGPTRGELLRATAVAAPGRLLGRPAAAAAGTRPAPRSGRGKSGTAGMNVRLFRTDQQRAIQHFPVSVAVSAGYVPACKGRPVDTARA